MFKINITLITNIIASLRAKGDNYYKASTKEAKDLNTAIGASVAMRDLEDSYKRRNVLFIKRRDIS